MTPTPAPERLNPTKTRSLSFVLGTDHPEVAIPGVAYVRGLPMRRAPGLYAGAAKTDLKDAQAPHRSENPR